MTRIEFDGLVCDLDGVVYKGDVPIAGVPEALTQLRNQGIRIVYCTNNSRSTVTDYLRKLRGFGITSSRRTSLPPQPLRQPSWRPVVTKARAHS